jgi:hypothetical protein
MRIIIKQTELGPQYRHDCETCIFLGRYSIPNPMPTEVGDEVIQADLYFHPSEDGSLVVRSSERHYSSERSSNVIKHFNVFSPQDISKMTPHTIGILEAFFRAQRKDLIPERIADDKV